MPRMIIFLKNTTLYLLCVCTWACICHDPWMKVRTCKSQFLSFHCEGLGSNLSSGAWWQGPLHAEPSDPI